MLLSIQKFPPVVKLYFRIVCDPNMNYKVAPPFEGEKGNVFVEREVFLLSRSGPLFRRSHTRKSPEWESTPLSPNRSQDFYGSLHLGRGGIRWRGILSSRETQFYTSLGNASGQGQRSETFEPWFSSLSVSLKNIPPRLNS